MRSINISTVTVGTDPEGFLVKKDNNEFYPACGIIGGDKWSPKKIKDGGYAIQEDNVMVEFNVPYTTLDNPTKIHNDIQFVLDHIRGIVEPKGLEVKMVPSAYFNWEHLDTEQARTFGCDPDFNAWTEEVNVISRKDVNLRTAGGHVHIGYENPDAQTNIELIKLMDLFLGVPSILLDTDTERRKMYGKAGCFRFTEFGVEYRVLSNFWTTSLENIKWLFDGIKQAVEAYNNGMRIDSNSDLAKSINSCINNQNEDFAIEICEEFNIKLNNVLV